MWWRRCTSPVVGSTASAGAVRKSCERCMPRLDGDFLFCWTAMFYSSKLKFQCLLPPKSPRNYTKGDCPWRAVDLQPETRVPLRLRAGPRELKALDDRLLRHTGTNGII